MTHQQILDEIQEWFKLAMQLFPFVFIILKWKDIKEVFCEKGGGMSSKRVIALMGMVTICRIALYTTQADDKVDTNMLIVLTVIVLTSAAIATFPQILDLIGKIKNIATPKQDEPSNPQKATTTTTTVTEVPTP